MPSDPRQSERLAGCLQMPAEQVPPVEWPALLIGKHERVGIDVRGTKLSENRGGVFADGDFPRAALRLGLVEPAFIERLPYLKLSRIEVDTAPPQRQKLSDTQARHHEHQDDRARGFGKLQEEFLKVRGREHRLFFSTGSSGKFRFPSRIVGQVVPGDGG